MAYLGTLAVADRNARLGSGGAFLLKYASKIDDKYIFPNGEEVEISAGSPYAVVRFNGTSDPASTFSKAFETIHEGLNGIAAQEKTIVEVHKTLEECLLWWRSDGQQTLRASCTVPMGLTMTATLTVTDAQGNVKPPDPIPSPLVHECLDHFRRSQTTDSLFESFREMYLAFESLLSWRIQRKRGECDVDWLKRALSDADSQTNLFSKCSPKWTDFPNEFYDQIYVDVRCGVFHSVDVRCGVFHSKDAHQNLYPYRLADRAIVANALARLGQILILLFQDWLQVRILTSGLTHFGFERGTQWLDQDTEIMVSSSDLPIRSDEGLASPALQVADSFPSMAAVDESHAGLKIMIGSIAPTDLTLSSIRRCSLKDSENLILNHLLEDDLTLESVDRFQVALGLRLRNLSPPKSYFLE